LTYTYLSDGTKVSAIKSNGSGKRYLGSAVYSVPESDGGSETLESAAWDEGRIGFTKSGSTYTLTDHWFVKDHLGNVRSVVDVSPGLSSPQVVERNDYLPYGTRLSVGNAVLATNRYRLGGKEEQTFGSLDLGKVDFGARQYDPFTARWTTLDPMATEYARSSPFVFCVNNPTNCMDVDGRWIPDKEGNLTAETGDDFKSLAMFLGVSESVSTEMLQSQGYDVTNGPLEEGSFLKLDNVYTKSIQSSSMPTTDALLSGLVVPSENDYNCWGAAIAGTSGIEIKTGVGIDSSTEFDAKLTVHYENVQPSEAQFGKTVLRFADKNNVSQHGAVYYGTDHSGNVYVYTKNGWHAKPEVMSLSSLLNKIPSYGNVQGIRNNSGYYTVKSR
jgi:RHS repeat-associated protein